MHLSRQLLFAGIFNVVLGVTARRAPTATRRWGSVTDPKPVANEWLMSGQWFVQRVASAALWQRGKLPGRALADRSSAGLA